MADSKIIFIDVDGTLVDYENKLPASADKAIKQARKNGHRVYICTGRSKAEVYPYLWDIGLVWHDWWEWQLCRRWGYGCYASVNYC